MEGMVLLKGLAWIVAGIAGISFIATSDILEIRLLVWHVQIVVAVLMLSDKRFVRFVAVSTIWKMRDG